MTRVEFYNALVNRGDNTPSEIKLKWKCTKKKHIWQASYHSIRKGYGCSRCPKGSKVITYKKCIELGNAREDLNFDMSKEEFDNAIEERGSKRPSSVKLRSKPSSPAPTRFWILSTGSIVILTSTFLRELIILWIDFFTLTISFAPVQTTLPDVNNKADVLGSFILMTKPGNCSGLYST